MLRACWVVKLISTADPAHRTQQKSVQQSSLLRSCSKASVGKATAFKYAATVRNGTEPIPSRGHNNRILRKKKQKQIEDATKASVKKEMAQPRMAKSARIADLILGTSRIPAKASIATDKKARQRLGLRP
jgi:hypothetical protein